MQSVPGDFFVLLMGNECRLPKNWHLSRKADVDTRAEMLQHKKLSIVGRRSPATNRSLVPMPNGRLSLVILGHEDQRRPRTKAITSQLRKAYVDTSQPEKVHLCSIQQKMQSSEPMQGRMDGWMDPLFQRVFSARQSSTLFIVYCDQDGGPGPRFWCKNVGLKNGLENWLQIPF